MKRGLLLAAVVLALGASEASAHTTILCEPCSYPYQQWVDEAKVPTPDVTLTVIEEPCPGDAEIFACTEAGASTWFYVSLVRAEAWSPRGVFLHEVGHSFDGLVLTDWDRERFRVLLEVAQRPWESLEEDFADNYMRCAAPRIYPERYRRACHLIRTSMERARRFASEAER
jgi:hypothetical protein